MTVPTSVSLSLQAQPGPDGLNRPVEPREWPIQIDPNLGPRGEYQNVYGSSAIVLREWNEQVLLHEVLHVLLDPLTRRQEGDGYNHRVVAPVEASLFHAGWRFRP